MTTIIYLPLKCIFDFVFIIGDYDSYIYSFSFIKSIKEFSRYEEGNELNIFNGFKFLEMSAILYGHRFMYFAGNPLIYSIPVEDVRYKTNFKNEFINFKYC